MRRKRKQRFNTFYLVFGDTLNIDQVSESRPLLSGNSLSAQAIEASKAARAHSMDVRVNKKKVGPLNTTAGLNYARAGNVIAISIDKIQVQIEVRVKDLSKRSSQTTDPSFGKWGRPWGKDEYLSGKIWSQLSLEFVC